MCGALACCAGEAVCCAGACCCGIMCKVCSLCGVQSKTFAKIGFVFFQLLWVIISIILLYTAKHLVNVLPHFMQCPGASGDGSACMGVSAIIRMSFTLACFHIVIFCIILARNTPAAVFHDGCWFTKSMMVLGFFIGMMWVPNWWF
jgi:hypothetical protein